MRDALATVDRARRKADYAIVQRAIVRDLPIFTLWQVRIPDAYRTYVHGISPAPEGSTFWNAWSWQIGHPDLRCHPELIAMTPYQLCVENPASGSMHSA